MAKAQVKKKAATAPKKPAKVAKRVKTAIRTVKKAPAKVVAKAKAKAKPVVKKASARRPAAPARPVKASKKVVRSVAKAKARAVPKAAKKPLKKTTVISRAAKSKPVKGIKRAAKAVVAKPKAKLKVAAPAKPARAAKPAAKPIPQKKAPAPKPVPVKAMPQAKVTVAAPVTKGRPPKLAAIPAKVASAVTPPRPAVVDDKKRARRPRPRIVSNGTPVAAWLTPGEKPRSSSFIPAPARAEAPSLIAAPPASSDRLIRPEDVSHVAVRTVPVRVDVEQGGGRMYLGVTPDEVTLRSGEGIEWDFRYFGGADVMSEEIVIEFEKPSPFPQNAFRSHKPGTARPHRQLSGPAEASAAGKRIRYTIRAMTPFKTELAVARPWVNITQ